MTCVVTAGVDIIENVLVIVQGAVEDEAHGELREDKTQLARKRQKTGIVLIIVVQTHYPTSNAARRHEMIRDSRGRRCRRPTGRR